MAAAAAAARVERRGAEGDGSGGRRYFARAAAEPGDVLLVAEGVEGHASAEEDEAVAEANGGVAGAALLCRVLRLMGRAARGAGDAQRICAQIDELCPTSLEAAPPAQRAKFASDSEAVGGLADEAGVPRARAQLLQLQLDINAHEAGLFPAACFFNHSCAHNCFGAPERGPDGQMRYVVRAAQRVRAGEELTLNYLPPHMWYRPAEARRAALRASHYFECACARCSGAVAEEADLDAERCARCKGWRRRARGWACEKCGAAAAGDELAGPGLAAEAAALAASEMEAEEAVAMRDSDDDVKHAPTRQRGMSDEADKDACGRWRALLARCEARLHTHHWVAVLARRGLAGALRAALLRRRQYAAADETEADGAALQRELARALEAALASETRVSPPLSAAFADAHEQLAALCELLDEEDAAEAHRAQLAAILRACGAGEGEGDGDEAWEVE